jgi:excisionase family DNA binding protein
MNDAFPNDKHTSQIENLAAVQDLWTTREVAKFLHVSIKTIFNLRKKGLPFVYVGGAVRFEPQKIKDYLANSRRLASHRSRQIVCKGESIA